MIPIETPPVHPRELPIDKHRGTMGMILAIVTEAMLFVSMFFAYFYVAHKHVDPWPVDPPKIKLALIMLAILVTSSVVLQFAEHQLKKGAHGLARLLLGCTIALGAAFFIIQCFEYHNHLQELKPTSNAYGSLFYVITSLHGLHILVGLAMLLFVLALPRLSPHESPHQPLHNAGLYWHFVDVVWLFIVGLLYILPHWNR